MTTRGDKKHNFKIFPGTLLMGGEKKEGRGETGKKKKIFTLLDGGSRMPREIEGSGDEHARCRGAERGSSHPAIRKLTK